MKKKILSFALVFAMILSLSACGSSGQSTEELENQIVALQSQIDDMNKTEKPDETETTSATTTTAETTTTTVETTATVEETTTTVTEPVVETEVQKPLNLDDDVFTIENGVLKEYKGGGGVVVIPDGVIAIGDKAFVGVFKEPESVKIPDSVTSIGYRAFESCISLTSIEIPDSVTSIGKEAFMLCQNLKSITIPDSVTDIGYGAFKECFSLESIKMPESSVHIGANAFYRTAYADNSSNYEDGILYLGNHLIFGSVSYADGSGFLGKDYKIKHGTCDIADGAFISCKSLENITIPDSVTEIKTLAFMDCANLKSITIPDSVTKISEGAFNGCKNLTEINASPSIKEQILKQIG